MKARKDPENWRVPTKPPTSWRLIAHGEAPCYLTAASGESSTQAASGKVALYSGPEPPLGELFVLSLDSQPAGSILIHQSEMNSITPSADGAYALSLQRPVKWFDGQLFGSVLVSPTSAQQATLNKVMRTSLMVTPGKESEDDDDNVAYKQSAKDHMKFTVQSAPEFAATIDHLSEILLALGATKEMRGGLTRPDWRRRFLLQFMSQLDDLLLELPITATPAQLQHILMRGVKHSLTSGVLDSRMGEREPGDVAASSCAASNVGESPHPPEAEGTVCPVSPSSAVANAPVADRHSGSHALGLPSAAGSSSPRTSSARLNGLRRATRAEHFQQLRSMRAEGRLPASDNPLFFNRGHNHHHSHECNCPGSGQSSAPSTPTSHYGRGAHTVHGGSDARSYDGMTHMHGQQQAQYQGYPMHSAAHVGSQPAGQAAYRPGSTMDHPHAQAVQWAGSTQQPQGVYMMMQQAQDGQMAVSQSPMPAYALDSMPWPHGAVPMQASGATPAAAYHWVGAPNRHYMGHSAMAIPMMRTAGMNPAAMAVSATLGGIASPYAPLSPAQQAGADSAPEQQQAAKNGQPMWVLQFMQ